MHNVIKLRMKVKLNTKKANIFVGIQHFLVTKKDTN